MEKPAARGCVAIQGTLSGNRKIVMPSNAATRRVAQRAGLVVYMLRLPVCYALAYLGVHGIARVIAGFRC